MPRTTAQTRTFVALVVAAILASGCGSTVDLTTVDGDVTSTGEDFGLSMPSPSGTEHDPANDLEAGGEAGVGDADRTSGEAPTAADGTTDTTQRGDDGAGSTTGTEPDPDGNGTDAGIRPVAPGTRGVDDERIVVGFAYSQDTGEANAALGAGGSSGNPEHNYRALLEYFNARGGAAGREIVPVYHRWNVTSSQSFSAQEQAACERFTQDNQVFVALAPGLAGFSDGTLSSCLDAAGTPVIGSLGISDTDDATFGRLPHYVETNTLSLDAIAALWPEALAESNYFEPRGPTAPTKIGLVTYDTERMRRVTAESLEPAMAAIGHTIDRTIYVRQPGSLSEVGNMTAQVQNAVLRFNTERITHVMIQDSGSALLTLVFLNSAEGQGYRPRYGLTSNNGGQSIVEMAPAAQYADSRMVGWFPLFDVPRSELEDPPGAALRECERIYEEAGIAFSDTNARRVGYIACDEVRSLIAAVEAGSGPLSQASLVPSFVDPGESFESVLVGPTTLSQQRRYGVARHRLAEFFNDCTCFRYTSGWRATP